MENPNTQIISVDKIEADISISNPTVTDNELLQIAQDWIIKQGRYWPPEISSDRLLSGVNLVYLPYWVVSGYGEAQWSASIGVEREVLKRCKTCGGKGRHTPLWDTEEKMCDRCGGSGKSMEKETFWSSQSGFVQTSVDNRIVENYDSKSVALNCGKRKFKANFYWVNKDDGDRYTVIKPVNISQASGQDVAQQAVVRALRSDARFIGLGMGRVRNLQLANVQVGGLESYMLLYPLHLGNYTYEDEELAIQIDGITKSMWADIPTSVREARRKLWLTGLGVLTALSIAFYIAFENEIDAFEMVTFVVIGLLVLWGVIQTIDVSPVESPSEKSQKSKSPYS